MSAPPKIGNTVQWKWGAGTAKGKVTSVHKQDVTKTIKGSRIIRHASAAKPALEIATDKGDKVLKSVSEVKALK